MDKSEGAAVSDAMLTLRLADAGDALDILHWRNDSHTRLMSRSSAVIEEDHHRAWFARALKDPGRILLLGTDAAQKIGMVRFDRHGAVQWEINIIIAPEVRGQGLGRHLLSMAIAHFFSLNPEASLLAEVKEDNAASHRLFASLGFAREAPDGDETVRYRLRPYRLRPKKNN